ncbi:hypothetical protein E2C01_012037 [Portunus trituberculatus]|uniref:Uncharacterized protein n=1 Tax=Portunus trituberculatus TaxID=210409 RepID=A0A5B7DD25_PORTR|nr:hypothetical protein [Portunus trituberculatus]
MVVTVEVNFLMPAAKAAMRMVDRKKRTEKKRVARGFGISDWEERRWRCVCGKLESTCRPVHPQAAAAQPHSQPLSRPTSVPACNSVMLPLAALHGAAPSNNVHLVMDTRCATRRVALINWSDVIRLALHHKFQVHAEEALSSGMQCNACVIVCWFSVWNRSWFLVSLVRPMRAAFLMTYLFSANHYVYTWRSQQSACYRGKGALCRNGNRAQWTQVKISEFYRVVL